MTTPTAPYGRAYPAVTVIAVDALAFKESVPSPWA